MSWLDYFNPHSGLEVRKKEKRTTENNILWLAQLVALSNNDIIFELPVEAVIYNLRTRIHRLKHKLQDGWHHDNRNFPEWIESESKHYAHVLGLYDRSYNESITGSPQGKQFFDLGESAVRTISRDNMFAIIYLSLKYKMKEQTYIADMLIRSCATFPNQAVGILFNPLCAAFWDNFQFQPADWCFYLLMSDRKWHNYLGWTMYPVYWISQLFVARKSVKEADGVVRQKNSGDNLLWIRQLCFEMKYGFRHRTADELMMNKWGAKDWHLKALYAYHTQRGHDFPVTHVIEKILSQRDI